MRANALVGFIVLLIIGVALTTREDAPKLISDVGGLLALVGGVGFAIYILQQLRILK